MRQCKDCQYFENHDHLRMESDGWCHRYPPQVVFDPTESKYGFTQGPCTEFPMVQNSQWCGEFSKRTGE